MKAWHTCVPDCSEMCSLLVFAKTRGRARALAYNAGLWDYGEFTSFYVRRSPYWDDAFDTEKVVETNEDIPSGFPDFYDDSECWQ